MKKEPNHCSRSKTYFEFPIFADLKETYPYIGHYYGGENLEIYHLDKIKYHGEKAWKIFYQYAQIYYICLEFQLDISKPSEDEIQEMYDLLDKGLKNHNLAEKEKLLIKFLKQLRDKPSALEDTELNELFLYFWCEARYSINKKEVRLLRKLFPLCLPKPEQHRARGILSNDQRLLLAYNLMKRIAYDLQRRCKVILNEMDCVSKEDLTSLIKNKEEYADFLKECAADDVLRYLEVKPDTIKQIRFSPIKEFLNPQLAHHFHCSPDRFKKHLLKIGK